MYPQAVLGRWRWSAVFQTDTCGTEFVRVLCREQHWSTVSILYSCVWEKNELCCSEFCLRGGQKLTRRRLNFNNDHWIIYSPYLQIFLWKTLGLIMPSVNDLCVLTIRSVEMKEWKSIYFCFVRVWGLFPLLQPLAEQSGGPAPHGTGSLELGISSRANIFFPFLLRIPDFHNLRSGIWIVLGFLKFSSVPGYVPLHSVLFETLLACWRLVRGAISEVRLWWYFDS